MSEYQNIHAKNKLSGADNTAGSFVTAFRAAEAIEIRTLPCIERGVGNFKKA